MAPKKPPTVARVAPSIDQNTPPCRPPLRRHHDTEKHTTAMELVVACTSPTRASASSVSTQSDIPLATAGRAVSTPRPTKVRAAFVLPRPMRSNAHVLVHSPIGSCTSIGWLG